MKCREQLQQRAAEQLFRVLGELKGGAMKFGQALSLFESVLPEEVAAPYRAHLSRLQDAGAADADLQSARRTGAGIWPALAGFVRQISIHCPQRPPRSVKYTEPPGPTGVRSP